jgi:ribosomal protein S18 acetylase RimI-like enzyme
MNASVHPVRVKRGSSARQIACAIEVFARGFCFTRSLTHPYLAERVGPIWVVRDAPRQHEKDYRREEWIAHGIDPAKIDATARKHTRGRFAVCALRAIDEPDAPLRDSFKRLGYRLGATEALMMHDLKRIPQFDSPLPIHRVTTQELAERFGKAKRRKPLDQRFLRDDSPLRQYVAIDGSTRSVIGWVASIQTTPDAASVWDMYVHPRYRRRGIGRALMSRMLHDDRDAGVKLSQLTASHTGALLYAAIGYSQIGELLLFTPPKKK